MGKKTKINFFRWLVDWYGISTFFKKNQVPEGVKFPTPEEIKEANERFKKLMDSYQYSKISEEHFSFVEKLIAEEENRQSIIENKLGQIIGQSGIIFALIALFAPLFYEQLSGFGILLKILFLFLFFIGFIFFLLSIIHATKSFNIKKFIYSSPSIESVVNKGITSKDMFIQETIKAKVTGIPINRTTNDSKGNLLLYSHRSFMAGFVSIGILGILVCASFILLKPKKIDFKPLESKIQETNEMVNILTMKSLTKPDSVKICKLRNQIDSLEKVLWDVKKKMNNPQSP